MVGPRGSSDAHLALFLEIDDEADPAVQARRATEEIERLDQERNDFSALRLVAVHKMHVGEKRSYARIAEATGVGKDRAAQLGRESRESKYGVAVQRVGALRRAALRMTGRDR